MAKPETWKVLIHRRAEKILFRLSGEVLKHLWNAINKLGDNPKPNGCKKIQGYENLYRIRVGEWRITYAIEKDELIILIVEIAPRGDAYRNI